MTPKGSEMQVSFSLNMGRKLNIWALIGFLDLISVADKNAELGLRDVLPEPIDIFDHAGNGVVPMLSAFASAYIVAKGITALDRFSTLEGAGRARQIGMGVGLAVAVAANALVETRVGHRILPIDNTPDLIDLAYGSAAGAFGASMVEVRPQTL